MGLHRWYKGQLVFYRCLNPAVGEVVRSSDNYEWVEVRWLDSKKAARYPKRDIQPLNGVLNYWLQRDTNSPFNNATIPQGDLIAVTSEKRPPAASSGEGE